MQRLSSVFPASLQIAKRFQDSWKSSVAEAESVLQERLKMTSSISSSVDDTFHDSSTPERENKTHPTFISSTSPVSTLPQTMHMTNGSISSLRKTQTKPSTLKKSSGKKKSSKSSKDMSSKHSKKTLQNSTDQSDIDSGECPYSDLDSVPKILCPKALERQAKLVPSQPSSTVVKEVKKQPEIQSGLWFSKSSKDRRPKTTSPMPDRTLFSKLPCKKKSSKKILVASVATGSVPSDQSVLPDRHKLPVPTETDLPSEESGHLKCKNTPVANRPFGMSGSLADHSGLSDELKPLASVETSVPSDKCRYSKYRQLTDTVAGTASKHFGSSEVKKTLEPSKEVDFNDHSRLSEILESITQNDRPHVRSNKKVKVIDKISDHAEEKERNQTQVLSLNADTDNPLPRLEKQTSVVSKCKLPFVKLIRKDIKGKKFLSSTKTISPIDQPGRTKNEKTRDKNLTKISSRQSERTDSKAGGSIDQTGPIKVSVKKLKANGRTGILHLSSESSQEKTIDPPNTVFTEELGGQEACDLHVNVTYPLSNQSDSSECKKTSASNETSMSSDQLGSLEQNHTPKTTSSNTTQPSHQQSNAVARSAHVSTEKSKKVAYKSNQVSVLHEQPAHLPASSRLMTRALKALQEAEEKKQKKNRKGTKQKKLLNPLRKSEDIDRHSGCNSTAKQDVCSKIKSLKSINHNESGEYDRDTFSSCSTPSLMFSDSTDYEVGVKSEDEDLSISSTPPMDFIPLTSRVKTKKEDQPTDMSPTSAPSSPFSFMNAFKNVEELSFQSLANGSNGKPISFKPDMNYKFSTFLMMLKDLHDTREREGTPLELEIGPPSAHVKKEPLVMPGEATPAGPNQQNEHVNGSNSSLEKNIFTHNENNANRMSKRSYNRKGSCTLMKKKANRKVPCRPARSGPGFPGLESLPGVASLPMVHSMQAARSERQADGDGVAREEESWSRVNVNLQNVVPLVQQGSDTTLGPGQSHSVIAHCTENNTSLMYIAGGGDKAQTCKDSVVKLINLHVQPVTCVFWIGPLH